MRVLITGAGGFIGSHLAEMLARRGFQVRSMVEYSSDGNWGWLESSSLKSEMEVVSGDVRDPDFCLKAASGIDAIFHLAALIAIPYSYSSPQSYIDTNVTGTLNMLRAAIMHGCSRFLQTSTSEVYGSAITAPIEESHPLQPQSPYSASKIGADSIAMSYFHSFGLPVTVARPFNTFGPRQSARAVIPSIVSQIAAGAEVIEVGDLRPTRDFNFVTDTCNGFMKLLQEQGTVGEVIHFGSGREISIGELFQKIARLMKRDVSFHVDPERLRPEGSEVMRLLASNDKAFRLAGYTPEVGLEQGLEATIEWFLEPENLRHYKTGIYNV